MNKFILLPTLALSLASLSLAQVKGPAKKPSTEQPAVSVLSSGQVDCATMADFVDRLAPASLAMAEDSLVAAVTQCPKQTADSARLKVETALDAGSIAARPLMALMESSGAKSRWS